MAPSTIGTTTQMARTREYRILRIRILLVAPLAVLIIPSQQRKLKVSHYPLVLEIGVQYELVSLITLLSS
jgi:hypothetical protein